MRQRDYNSGSFSPNGCGCLVLLILVTAVIVLVIPSFLCGNMNNAKKSEGKQYISSMNKGQQAYYAENTAFSNSVTALGLGLKTETTNYKYSIRAIKTAAFSYAFAKNKTLKNYVGGVFLVPAYPNAPKDEMTTVTILCETDDDRPFFRVKLTDEPDEPAEPIYQNGEVICGIGTTKVTR